MRYSLILDGKRGFFGWAAIVLLAACPVSLAAGPRFSNLLHDSAVLQRGVPVTVRGVAEPGRKVSVSFAGQTKGAVADEGGQWSVVLDAMPWVNAVRGELWRSAVVRASVGRTAVWITADRELAARADRTVVLRGGSLRATEPEPAGGRTR